jgi:hypothetical protein
MEGPAWIAAKPIIQEEYRDYAENGICAAGAETAAPLVPSQLHQ